MSLDFDPSIDHYKVLGVDPKASADDIKKAYRKLAKQYHPDSTGGDKVKETRFKEINNAYDVLSDGKKRSTYDAIRAGGGPGGGFPGAGFPGAGFPGGFPGAGFSGGGRAGRPGAPGEGFDLGDLFGQFFSGGRQGPRVRVEHFDFGDPDVEAWTAERGPRRRRDEPAEGANLRSRVQASDGSWLTVQGGDVHSELRIPFDRAILGTVVEVATVDGKASVKVPPGTSSGRKLRLRGKGVIGPAGPAGPAGSAGSASSGGQAGDHYVTVQIDVPRDLDDEAKKLLIELVRRTGSTPSPSSSQTTTAGPAGAGAAQKGKKRP
jgi:molecular chaperone DnaJ